MNVGLVLDMAASGFPDRSALTVGGRSFNYADLAQWSWAASEVFKESEASGVVYVGTNGLAYPICLFGAAGASIPFIPLNYRLGDMQLRAILSAHPDAFVVHEPGLELGIRPGASAEPKSFLRSLDDTDTHFEPASDPNGVCVILHTSGTTAAPKAALLRHRHLMAYIVGTVEFGSAGADEAALVAVPPYHVAGLGNLLSNVYSGRRIVYTEAFDPADWLATVRAERITQAMVVPTMLARIVRMLGADEPGTPTLRALSYGGSRIPPSVLERALALFPGTEFVNAYGLTETTATIALLSGADHRAALSSAEPAVRRRIGSVGRLLPGIQIEVRGPDGQVTDPEEAGLLFVRGEQISGEYLGGNALDADGWFPTRDRGWVDRDGYLFIEGRADDTIIRGGENIAPAEIEDALLAHPEVADAVVVGLPDEEWGQRIGAGVVLVEGSRLTAEALRAFVRRRLRSSKTPEIVEFLAALPRGDTGKVLRHDVVERFTAQAPSTATAGSA